MRDHAAERQALQEQIAAIDAEPAPAAGLAEIDLAALAHDLTALLQSGYNPATIRAFCGEFITRVVIEERMVRLEYDPRRLVECRPLSVGAVPSTRSWLPGSSSPGTVTRPLPARLLLPRRARG